ncbi:MAG: hypothetical protein JWO06_1497 [Bacteroidota bacterium]|nr:hypothetical protein [Bacteroidota bacterium]
MHLVSSLGNGRGRIDEMNIVQALKMSCRDATYLHEKKREGKISMSESMGLWFHLLICKFCALFFRQIEKLEESSNQLSEKQFSLTAERKAKLESDFKEELKR